MDLKKAFEQGRFLDIVACTDEVTAPEDRLLIGISMFKLGRDNEALRIFNEIARNVENLVKACYYMALIYSRQGDMGSARHNLDRYSVFHPEDDEARDILCASEGRDSLMSEASADLARIYAQQGHFEEALDIYARVLAVSGDNADPDMKKDALNVQDMYILKTLETWLERLQK